MFEFFRRMLLPVMIILLVAFLGWLVLDVGLDLGGRRSGVNAAADAGVINGEPITWDVFNRVYQNLYSQESQKSDGDVPDSRVKELEQNAWQQIVHDRLLFQEAAKHNIVVTDQEVFQYLRYSPPQYLQEYQGFMTNGKFDYQKYTQAMSDPQASNFWASLEPSIRLDLEKMKMQELVIQTVQVSEPEVKQAFIDHNEKIQIGLISIPYSRFNAQVSSPAEDEILQYYNDHKDEYKADERATLNVVSVPKESTEDDWLRTKARLQLIRDSVAGGADFAAMATTYSQDASAPNGGDVGWFEQGRMVPEFDKLSFSMKEGELSEPFRTQFGWHIIKHLGYRDQPVNGPDGKPTKQTRREAHVAHILLKVTPSQESVDANYRKLQDFVTAAGQKGFAEAAKEANLTVNKTAPFPKNVSIQYIGQDVAASAFAFDNPPNTISDVLENANAIYVVQVAERLPAGIASVAEVRPQIAMDIRNKKLAAICHDTAQVIYNAVKVTRDFPAVARQHASEYLTTDLFSRDGYTTQFGRDPIAIGAAFAMTSVGQISGPVDDKQGSLVMTLLERVPADLTQFEQKRDSVLNALRSTKQQEFYNRWVQDLMKNSKIVSNVGRATKEKTGS